MDSDNDDDKYLKIMKKQNPITKFDIIVGILCILFILSLPTTIFTTLNYFEHHESSSSPLIGCDVPKCNLTSDIIPFDFVSGVTGVLYDCYYGSTQIRWKPPADPLNYDFSSTSLSYAINVCSKSILTKLKFQYEIVPFKSAGCTVLNDIYDTCSIVFICSEKFIQF